MTGVQLSCPRLPGINVTYAETVHPGFLPEKNKTAVALEAEAEVAPLSPAEMLANTTEWTGCECSYRLKSLRNKIKRFHATAYEENACFRNVCW